MANVASMVSLHLSSSVNEQLEILMMFKLNTEFVSHDYHTIAKEVKPLVLFTII